MSSLSPIRALVFTLIWASLSSNAFAQLGWNSEPTVCLPDLDRLGDDRNPPGKEPRTIDPVTVVPEALRKKLTVDYDGWPLDRMLADFGERIGLPVIIDEPALTDVGLPVDEPVTERLQDEPAYLLLKRPGFSKLGLTGYVRDDVLRIATVEIADELRPSRTYDIADLLDAGMEQEALRDTIQNCTNTHWGEGIISELDFLNSAMVFKWNVDGHEELTCLLAALRNHGEQTFFYDPTENIQVRERLEMPVTVSFDAVPLSEFATKLGAETGLAIHVDERRITDVGIPLDEPITIALEDRNLSTVLEVALESLWLVAVPYQGQLMITTQEIVGEQYKGAVYAVGDLCLTRCDTENLINTLHGQVGGSYILDRLCTPRPDILVFRGSELEHANLLQFLRGSRQTLSERPTRSKDYAEIETRYYQVSAQEADDLLVTLPELIEPGTWKRVTHPSQLRIETLNESGIGGLLRVATAPSIREVDAPALISDCPDDENGETDGKEAKVSKRTLITPQSTLIIRHTKLTQLKIARLMERLSRHNFGHNDKGEGLGPLNGGGGGFFNVAPENSVAVPTPAP